MITNWRNQTNTYPKYSIVGDKQRADGSFENPRRLSEIAGYSYIGGGSFGEISCNTNNIPRVIGSGFNHTRIERITIRGTYQMVIDAMTVGELVITDERAYFIVNSCIILNKIQPFNSTSFFTKFQFRNSILRIPFPVAFNGTYDNVFSRADITSANGSLSSATSLFTDCTITLEQQNITDFANSFAGFNNCTFRVGNVKRKLKGNTEQELRQDFIALLTEGGITNIPTVNSYLGNGKMNRWVFDNNSMGGYRVINGSVIDHFIIENKVPLGGVDVHGRISHVIKATSDVGKKNAITPNTITKQLEIADDMVVLGDHFDIVNDNDQYLTTNVISLNGTKKITELDYLSNLPMGIGFTAGASSGIVKEVSASEPLLDGRHYLVRTKNTEQATVKYDDKTYNSSPLSDRNNTFLVTAAAGLTLQEASDNVKLFLLRGAEMYYPIEMRIVNSIPSQVIKTGELLKGMWYFINSSTGDQNAFVTYNGVKYEAGASFLATDTKTFTTSGDCFLNRCFYDDHKYNDARDTFYHGTQQPVWFKVDTENPKCIMTYRGSQYSAEMLRDENGEYYASGHPTFYNHHYYSDGTDSIMQDIQGQFFQIRIKFNTQDVMY